MSDAGRDEDAADPRPDRAGGGGAAVPAAHPGEPLAGSGRAGAAAPLPTRAERAAAASPTARADGVSGPSVRRRGIAAPRSRRTRLRDRFYPGWLGPTLVFVGGCLGAWCRVGIGAAGGAWRPAGLLVGWPTILVNLVGAVALGWLTGRWGAAPQGVRARLKMLLGTGFCGAFTTYSSLSLVVKPLADPAGVSWGALGAGVGQVIVLIAVGVAAAAVAVNSGRRTRWREERARLAELRAEGPGRGADA